MSLLAVSISVNSILYAVLIVGGVGLFIGIALGIAGKFLSVEVDEKEVAIREALPGNNCGGCGYPGCQGFADACVKSESLEGMMCPVGGTVVMSKVASILGKEVASTAPMIATVRCNGNCTNRVHTNIYNGAASCAIVSTLYAGETGCSFGCLGCGDCVNACQFDAIHINPEASLPEVDEEKCTACGACVKACPKMIIELRKKGPKSRRIFVSCVNKDKGSIARKACTAACIGCGKCEKTCPFGAITVENNLAYIDDNKCRLCRKCVEVCPTGAILSLNFPPKKSDTASLVAEDSNA